MVKMRKRRFSKQAKLVREREASFPRRSAMWWFTGKELIRAEGAVGSVRLRRNVHLDLKTGAIFKRTKK